MRSEGAPKEAPGCNSFLVPVLVVVVGLLLALSGCNDSALSCRTQAAASSGQAGYVPELDGDRDGVSCEQRPGPTLTP